MARPAPEPDAILTCPWRSTETGSSLTAGGWRARFAGASSLIDEMGSLPTVGESSPPSLTRSHPKPVAPGGVLHASGWAAEDDPLHDRRRAEGACPRPE